MKFSKPGTFDIGVANLFGSSVFNMPGIGIADFFYTEGSLLGAINPSFILIGLLAALFTNMALLGNLARIERKIVFIEADSAAIFLVYPGGMYLLYLRGL